MCAIVLRMSTAFPADYLDVSVKRWNREGRLKPERTTGRSRWGRKHLVAKSFGNCRCRGRACLRQTADRVCFFCCSGAVIVAGGLNSARSAPAIRSHWPGSSTATPDLTKLSTRNRMQESASRTCGGEVPTPRLPGKPTSTGAVLPTVRAQCPGAVVKPEALVFRTASISRRA